MDNRHRPRAWRLLLPMAVAMVGLATPGFAVERLDIETRGSQVRLSADAVDMRELLQQLAKQGNFKLWLSAALPAQPVSADIAMMPMEEALRELLVDNSFALVYGANGAVSALYVLPRGKSQSINATPDAESPDIREQMLHDALASPAVPDRIKASMLNQFHNDNDSFRQTLTAERPAAIEKLIEHLQQVGSASPETMQRLQQVLARERGLQIE